MDATDIKITALRARPVDVPMARPLHTSGGSVGSAPLVLIDLETEAGLTGHSYVFCYAPWVLAPVAAAVEKMGATLAIFCWPRSGGAFLLRRCWQTSHMKPARLALFFFALIAIASTANGAENIVGRASVIDGDALEIHGTRIRLHGIDAPESSQSCLVGGKKSRCGQRFYSCRDVGSGSTACQRFLSGREST